MNVPGASQVQHTIQVPLTLEHGDDPIVFRLCLGRTLVFEGEPKLPATQGKCNDRVVVLGIFGNGQFVPASDLDFVLPRNQSPAPEQIQMNPVDTQSVCDADAIRPDFRSGFWTAIGRTEILNEVNKAGRSYRE